MALPEINKKKANPRRQKHIDNNITTNDDSGARHGGVGSIGEKATRELEIIKAKEAQLTVKKMADDQAPIPTGKLPLGTERKMGTINTRLAINRSIEAALVKNMHVIGTAVDNYMEELSNPEGDKAVHAHFRQNFLTPETLKDMEKSQAKMMAENIDLQKFRILNRCHDVQQRILLSKYKLKLNMAGRRSGKTELNIHDAVWEAAEPEHRILIVCLTHETAMQLYWHPILKMLDDLGLTVAEKKSNDGKILLANGSIIQFFGNSTGDEREKMRGGKWHKVIIDEAQSHKALPYLVRDIISPMLLDYKGTLVMSGTGPRVRGTFWEAMWLDDKLKALRTNWNLSDNPFIPDHEVVLANIRAEKGLSESDTLYIREYLGKIAYDDEALVLRFRDTNYFTEEDFRTWVSQQNPSDIKFIGGLDYGFTDCDAFAIICYADDSPFAFVLYQYKMAREGIAELANGIRAGQQFVLSNPDLAHLQDHQRRDFYIFADTSDGRASSDLGSMLGMNIFPAYKHDKTAAIDFLQDDVRRNWLKIPKLPDGEMSPLEDEGMKTVFRRDDRDNLTRELDDEAYHPDMVPAVMYAMRSGPWAFRVSNR